MNNDIQESFVNLLDKEINYAVWEDVKKFPIETPMFAGIYLKDAFSRSGYSGGSIFEFSKDGVFTCHAQETWSILADIKDAIGVIIIPLQESEGVMDLGDIMLGVKLKFIGFSLSEKGVRVASFKVISITHNGLDWLASCSDILDSRKRAYEAYVEIA